jgi:hypothetical protein
MFVGCEAAFIDSLHDSQMSAPHGIVCLGFLDAITMYDICQGKTPVNI